MLSYRSIFKRSMCVRTWKFPLRLLTSFLVSPWNTGGETDCLFLPTLPQLRKHHGEDWLQCYVRGEMSACFKGQTKHKPHGVLLAWWIKCIKTTRTLQTKLTEKRQENIMSLICKFALDPKGLECMEPPLGCSLTLVGGFSNINDSMVVRMGEWEVGTSVFRNSLRDTEPIIKEVVVGKTNAETLSKGKGGHAQRLSWLMLSHTTALTQAEWMTYSKFLLQTNGSQAWQRNEITWEALQELAPGSNPRGSDLFALGCSFGIGLLLCSQDW